MRRWFVVASVFVAFGAFAGEATKETLRQHALQLINRDRVAAGLNALEFDPETSTIADHYCQSQIRNRTTGHFTLDGLAPYMRYSFAGGNDALLENAAGWSADHHFTERDLFDMVRRSHEAMMAERPPNDGHRRAILDAHATHAGIGLAWDRGEFRMAEEIERRWLVWQEPLRRSASMEDVISLAARPVDGATIEAIAVHHQPAPAPLTPAAASARADYSIEGVPREYLPRRESETQRIGRTPSDARRGGFPVRPDGTFRFTVPLTEGPGIYTVVVWLRRGDAVFTASNVSIRVDAGAVKPALAGGR